MAGTHIFVPKFAITTQITLLHLTHGYTQQWECHSCGQHNDPGPHNLVRWIWSHPLVVDLTPLIVSMGPGHQGCVSYVGAVHGRKQCNSHRLRSDETMLSTNKVRTCTYTQTHTTPYPRDDVGDTGRSGRDSLLSDPVVRPGFPAETRPCLGCPVPQEPAAAAAGRLPAAQVPRARALSAVREPGVHVIAEKDNKTHPAHHRNL